MTTDTCSEPTRNPLGSRTEAIQSNPLPWLVTLVPALYAAGFAVTQWHLARYGICSVSLLQSQYVLTGLWLAFPLAISISVPAMIVAGGEQWLSENQLTPPKGWRRFLYWPVVGLSLAASSLGIVTLVFLFLAALLGTRTVADLRLYLWLLAVVGGSSLVAAFFLVGGLIGAKGSLVEFRRAREPVTRLKALAWVVSHGTMAGVVLLLYVKLFAYGLFPSIPLALGGGRPTTMVFYLKAGPVQGTSDPLLECDSTGVASRPYVVVAATDRTFVVSRGDPSKGRVLEIQKEELRGWTVVGR